MEKINAFGVDFSASKNPANKIWLSECVLQNNSILLNETYSLKEKSAPNTLKNCSNYLVNLVKNNLNYAFGFDFSFSIPEIFLGNSSWEEFILQFSERWKSADQFKKELFLQAEGKEIKRATEIEAKVPFSTYNLWIYKQTYFGITEILCTLLHSKCCTILPFNSIKKNLPKILETCPASFLKNISTSTDLSKFYKGKNESHLKRREMILKILERNFNLKYKSKHIKEKIVCNTNGDALDSLLCAIIVIKSSKNNFEKDFGSKFKKEGYVYY